MARLPTLVLGGFRVQSHAVASRGSITLLTAAISENIHFPLFTACRPITAKDYFEEFHIHIILSFMLSVSSAFIESLSFYISEPSLKKSMRIPFKMFIKFSLFMIVRCLSWCISLMLSRVDSSCAWHAVL